MNYEGNIFRPPAEHNSILLQVTEGCSHNKCTFCGLYKDKKFKIKDFSIIKEDIFYAKTHFRDCKRLFLCDGDALIIPQQKLLPILEEINTHLPWLTRIGTYANAKSILKKSPEQLSELKKQKLSILYLGLESGDDQILQSMQKGVTVAEQVEAGLRAKAAGMKLSCTVLLGLGGKERSKSHAEKTGKALSLIDPNYASALSLMIYPQMPLYKQIQNQEFSVISPEEMLLELRQLIENTELTGGVFSANHASNYLPLQFRLPSGKKEALALIDEALSGNIQLKPEWMRAI